MRRFMASVLLFGATVVLAHAQGTAVKLDGAWMLTGIDGDKKLPEEFFDQIKARLIFKDGGYEQILKGETIEKGTFKVDPAKSTIDFKIETGKEKGQTQLGIFKLDGDKLTMAVGKAGAAERPKSFTPVKDVEVTIYKRGK